METLLKQSRIDNEPWTRKTKQIIACFFLFHLIISVIYLENIVWRINYASLRLISEGTPMYEQTTYMEGDQPIWLPPKHFPVYFYFMGFFAKFGVGEVGIRIITWSTLFPLFYFILKLSNIRNELVLLFLSIIFFLDPILIEINFIGKFDQFAIMFMLGGIYFAFKEQPLLSGLLIGIGTLSKFQPFFAYIAISVYYLRHKDWKKLVSITISCLGLIFGVMYYLYWKYGEGFTQVIEFQSTRRTPNLSMWYYLIPEEIASSNVLKIQLIFYFLIGLISLFMISENAKSTVLLLTSFYNVAFILGSSQYYSTYSYFFTLPFYPIMLDFHYRGKIKEILIFLIITLIYFIGLIFCFNSCYPTINPFTFISGIGIVLISLSTVMYTLFFGIIALQEKKHYMNDFSQN